MKILFVCRFLPHPKVRSSGGQDKYHYIASLSEQHEVSLISFVTPEQGRAVAEMRSICEQVVTVRYRPHALLPRLWRAWWRLLMPRVYGRVFSLRYRARLRDLLTRTHFDVAVVDGVMVQYGNSMHGVKRVLDEVDIYSVVAHHLYRNEKRHLPRLYLLFDWLRTLAFELHYAASYDGVLVRSEKDRMILQDHLPHQRFAIISPWFEGLTGLQSIAPRRPPGNSLLFVGAMSFPSNVEAVLYFAHRVLPLIQQRIPDVNFYIVGNSPSSDVRSLDEMEGVIVTGEVESLRPYYEKCAVNVVPLLTGGGIIVKTLNGMAAGRPTVTTPLGNSGAGARDGRDLLVAGKTAEAFAQAVTSLLSDEKLWARIAQSGQQFVRQAYDWPNIIQNLTGFLESIAQDHFQ